MGNTGTIGASFFGVKLVGVNAENGQKLLFTIIFVIVLWVASRLLRALAYALLRGRANASTRFWTRQGISLGTAILLILGVLSIWFNDPTRLATAVGLVTAGVAFALQRVITALAGYVVILRGQTFNVGDRITMGGVRGDVIALGFLQTTLMEMGQPPSVQDATPPIWVKSRQYTGRVVTVSNAKIFDEPVYNYTRDFPYLWEEIALPISYKDDRERAEAILLEAANRHTVLIGAMGKEALEAMQRRYNVRPADVEPKVYYRLTDNWLELTVRFVVEEHGIRDIKDAMSRDIIKALDAAGIGLASATYDIVGLPSLRIAGGALTAVDGARAGQG
jgi:small-conductance mechanosensitive channel